MATRTSYAETSIDEQEVVIRLDRRDNIAFVSSTWPSKSETLTQRYGSPYRTSEREGKVTCCFWKIPIKSVSFRRPSKKREATPSQLKRLEMARRMRSAPR